MTELTQQEMQQIDGGLVFVFLAGVAAGAVGGYLYAKLTEE